MDAVLDLDSAAVEALPREEKIKLAEALRDRQRRIAKDDFLSYACHVRPDYRVASHLERIAAKLEAVERGEIDRLMIFAPPRHGKSLTSSIIFPAWFLGRHPRKQIIAAAYGEQLVSGFGARIRNIMGAPEHFEVFGEEGTLSKEALARDHFLTKAGGVYRAAGVGGAITGFGADILLIDDPLRGREDADSETIRNKVWDWWQNDAYTRLMPGGAVICIQCMTGDTSVMMADGFEKPLRNVAVGDRIATYDNGRLTTSTVRNHRSNGPDKVWKIRTTSGITVKANGRHPFLVADNGEVKWIRTRDLRRGLAIVRVNGENGRVRPASGKGATSRSYAGAIAAPTTTRNGGPMAFVRHLLEKIQSLASAPSSSIAMASPLPTTGQFSRSRITGAPYANATHRMPGTPNTGTTFCASITATTPARFEGFSATTATLLSGVARRLKFWKPRLLTSDFTLDRIQSVEEAGVEEVFDVEIDRTENFIANGLVSHNTRWHEDDLAGRLLEESHGEWDVVSLPAIDDAGSALWPEMFDTDALERIRRDVGHRTWQALYQGDPIPDSGNFFQAEWFRNVPRYYGPEDAKAGRIHVYGASDYAVTTGTGDYTVHAVVGVDPDDNMHILDIWRQRTTPDIWVDKLLDMADLWKPIGWAEGKGGMQRAAEPYILKRQMERKIWFARTQLPETQDKKSRAIAFQGRMASGKVFWPFNAPWFADAKSELLRFDAGKHDDIVDSLSLIGRMLSSMAPGRTAPKPPEQMGVLTVGGADSGGHGPRITWNEVIEKTKRLRRGRRRAA